MFHEYLSKSDESSAISGMNLTSVWYVDADDSYVIKPTSGSGLVAIRTLDGQGRLYYKDGRVIEPGPNSLVYLEFADLKEYRCKGDRWQFWWFEFEVQGVSDFPLDRVLGIPRVTDEIERLNQIFLVLHSHDAAYSKFATAAFCFLMYEYGLKYHTEQDKEPYNDVILQIIRLMNERLESPMSVSQMAFTANMSERNFRKIFKKRTGRSPREFYFEIRMGQALSFLKRGYSVGRVSRMLGFSSQFYFSNAFSKHFGSRPSNVGDLSE